MEREKEDWELDGFDEKLDAANKRKAQGNDLYSQGKIGRAIQKYNRALEFLNYLGTKVSGSLQFTSVCLCVTTVGLMRLKR